MIRQLRSKTRYVIRYRYFHLRDALEQLQYFAVTVSRLNEGVFHNARYVFLGRAPDQI
jgi:hypothetical protein